MKIHLKIIGTAILSGVFIFSMFSCNVFNSRAKKKDFPDHPRIIFQPEDEAILSKKLDDDNYISTLSKVILDESDKMLEMEPAVYKLKGRRLLGVSRATLKRVMFLSYSYRITNDKKYLERAEKEMLAVSDFKDWNPHHFLDVAEMTAALGIGYDWLYEGLSLESKTIIKNAIIEKGFSPSFDTLQNGWLRKDNNWLQVCNSGLALGAMAIYESEPELSQEIIDRAMISMQIPLKEYEPDGVYVEGNTYWGYGTMYHVLFVDAYRKIYGKDVDMDLNNGFMQSAYFYLHVFGPTGSFNFSDCSTINDLTPAIYWFASELNDNNVLFNQNKILKELAKDNSFNYSEISKDRFLPFIPIWAARFENLDINEPLEKAWSGNGLNPASFHRTSWDEDAIFIGIKGGSASLSHAHMDAGSFVMDADGIRWAMDLGGHNYIRLEANGLEIWNRGQDSERWSVLRYSNYLHSTITVNNELQRVDGHATIIKSSDNEQFRNTVLDLSTSYKGQIKSALRGIAIADNNYVIIKDEIVNDDLASNIRWAMLTYDDIQIINAKTAIINKDGKQLKFMIVEPEDAKIQTYSTKPKHDFEVENPNTLMLGFEVNFKANEGKTLTVVLVPGDFEIPEEVDLRKLGDW